MLDEKDKPDYGKLKPVLFEMLTYKYLLLATSLVTA